jgi:hypothetical protein
MSSRVNVFLLVALVLVVTLLPKALTLSSPVDGKAEIHEKSAVLKGFLRSRGVASPKLIQPNRATPDWAGWSFSLPRCKAAAFADVENGDLLELLYEFREAKRTVFIYKGVVSDHFPRFWVARDKALYRIERVLHRPRWEKPLVVDLVYTGDCRALLAWDWSPMW